MHSLCKSVITRIWRHKWASISSAAFSWAFACLTWTSWQRSAVLSVRFSLRIRRNGCSRHLRNSSFTPTHIDSNSQHNGRRASLDEPACMMTPADAIRQSCEVGTIFSYAVIDRRLISRQEKRKASVRGRRNVINHGRLYNSIWTVSLSACLTRVGHSSSSRELDGHRTPR